MDGGEYGIFMSIPDTLDAGLGKESQVTGKSACAVFRGDHDVAVKHAQVFGFVNLAGENSAFFDAHLAHVNAGCKMMDHFGVDLFAGVFQEGFSGHNGGSKVGSLRQEF